MEFDVFKKKRCIRCVISESFPSVSFDSHGVCSRCLDFDNRWKNFYSSKPESEIISILGSARKKNPRYQCLAGVSGGKDSCFSLHLLVKKYRANVLAFTYDNGFLHDGARRNIEVLVSKLGVEHRYVSHDISLTRKMVLALMKNNCCDLCMICMNGMVSSFYSIALQENIPLLAWGNSPRTHSVMPLELINFLDYRFMVEVLKPHVSEPELAPFKNIDIPGVFYSTFIRRLKNIFVPEYGDWDDRMIPEILSKEYGWEDHGHGSPHFDCVANRAVNYFMNRRIGASKVEENVSQLVRCGIISRDEAFKKLKQDDDVEEPAASVDQICKRLDITRTDIKPLLEGSARDYRSFKGYASLFRKFSWLFYMSYRLGFTPKGLYQKYH
jgi:hypothetical protein